VGMNDRESEPTRFLAAELRRARDHSEFGVACPIVELMARQDCDRFGFLPLAAVTRGELDPVVRYRESFARWAEDRIKAGSSALSEEC
jgi:hypothetical protein